MHKNYNDITMRYGRDTCLSMRKLPASKIGALYRLQTKIGYYLDKWRLPQTLPDRMLQMTGVFMPPSLPNSLAKQACSYRYHLIIKVANSNNDDNSDDNGSHGHIAAAQVFLQSHMQQHQGVVHLCTAAESQALLVFRVRQPLPCFVITT